MYYTYEEIDRTLFERLRLKIVEYGYYPDITLYLGNPTGLKAAKDALRNSLPDKQLIELFGVGNAEARGKKTLNKITIDRKSTPKGTLGGFPEIEHEKVAGPGDTYTYTKRQLPDHTRDVLYEVRLHPSTAKFSRIMSDIVGEVFGIKRYMSPVKSNGAFDNTKSFFIEYESENDVSDEDMLETVIRYKVRDIFVAKEGKVLSVGIVPMTQVIADMMAVAVDNVEDTEMNSTAANVNRLVVGDGELPPPIQVPSNKTVEIRDQNGNIITTIEGGPGVFFTVSVISVIQQTLNDPPPSTIVQNL